MTNGRCFGRLAAAAVILLATALPGAADGVSQFEQKIRPQLPPNSFTYANAKALGDNGFVLEDVVVTPPADATGGAKAAPVAIKRVTVENFDFAGLDKRVPLFLKIRVEGITVTGKPAAGVDLNKVAGIDQVIADFALDYRVDPDRKTLTLYKLELDVGSLARLELSLVLDGVRPDLADKPDAAMNDATLRTATLTFEDRSLLSKVVPAAAKLQGTDVDAIMKQAKTMLGGMRAGQSAATLAVFDALGSYLDDYKHPKGPLKITVNPPDKASAAALSDIKSPDDAVKALGLVVTYGG
ncbi:MAG: hypothetical protein JO282_01875 [Alphaproteobacteria bacterium]|nr:hypothetical protein [Alphaproteobacteria bacterium]